MTASTDPRSQGPGKAAAPQLGSPGLDSAGLDREEFEDAALGDRPIPGGTVLSALRYPYYRRFFAGMFASSIGTWMQTVALGALAYDLTNDARFVAGLEFARMAPMLLLSLVGGAIADSRDRRRILVATQSAMLGAALGLAVVARDQTPRAWMLLALVAVFGVANSLGHPAMSTMLPHLVDRKDLSGAVALQSTQMNFSRVVGPAIGGLILPIVMTSGIFLINAVTYLFFIAVIFFVPRPPRVVSSEDGWHRLLGGFRAAKADPIVGRTLVAMTVISLLCLPFVGLLPVLAAENLGLDLTGDPAYGFFYACFGIGATLGALSVGTWLASRPRHVTIRFALAGWSVSLALFGLNRSVAVGFVLATVVGGFYFVTVTSLNTLLHEQVPDEVRGRVMALWMMAWGGTVPFGLIIGGQIANATSMTVVTLYGAFFLAVLAVFTRLDPIRLHRPRQTVRGRAPAR